MLKKPKFSHQCLKITRTKTYKIEIVRKKSTTCKLYKCLRLQTYNQLTRQMLKKRGTNQLEIQRPACQCAGDWGTWASATASSVNNTSFCKHAQHRELAPKLWFHRKEFDAVFVKLYKFPKPKGFNNRTSLYPCRRRTILNQCSTKHTTSTKHFTA